MNSPTRPQVLDRPTGQRWQTGHKVRLLENGEAFFPAVFEAIRTAKQEVLIETFILFQDKIGNELQSILIDAAKRGVRVELTVDGYGSPDLTPEFIGAMTEAGVTLHIFDPQPRTMGFRTNIFRRLHRKLTVVDRKRAFVGGINFSFDHVAEFGPEGKQDYAVEIEGPVVEDIRSFMEDSLAGRSPPRAPSNLRKQPIPQDVHGAVLFVTRDNDRRTTDIERHYRQAIRSARREVVIANAYFFPGFRTLRELRLAARRGVRVVLILQGQPDMAFAQWSARILYSFLLKAGVEIHEYCERPLHGKVAVVDSTWSTVGSSNLDPLSLSFNLESNLFILDHDFNRILRDRLEYLLQNHCKQFEAQQIERTTVQSVMTFLAFHFLRCFPTLAGLIPSRVPKVKTVQSPSGSAAESGAAPMDAANDNDQAHQSHAKSMGA